MDYTISSISIDNFKSYASTQKINISDLSIFLGANSSGKSTALQSLLALKQTMECNSRDIELLLSGQYVSLGEFDDVIYDKTRKDFSFEIGFNRVKDNEASDAKDSFKIKWVFEKAEDKFQALLCKIEVSYEDMCITFARRELNKYQMIVNSEKTPVFASIRNACLTGDLYLKYDLQFNKLFASFINEMKTLIEGRKSKKLANNSLVSRKIVPEFFLHTFNETRLNNEKKDIEAERIAEKITNLIEEYSLFQNPFGNDFYGFPHELKKNCLLSTINYVKKNDAFNAIYEKYENLLDSYREKKDIHISSYQGEELFRRYSVMRSGDDDNNVLEAYNWVNDFYESFEEMISRLLFVGPIRETPKGLYNIGFEQNPKYVGPTGLNFASVLLHENKKRVFVMPYGEEEEMFLWEALNEWALHLNIASAIQVSHATSFGIKVLVSDIQNKETDIMNVGIGTSQVLPVLITGLLSEPGETLVFEQPELHLHPFSQSRLADFFVSLINRGRKVLVETHSEAFLLRMRYHILKGNCNKDSVSINFFQNKHGTKVSSCNVSGYGNITYPDDFRDETQELLNDLMAVALKKEMK